MNRIVTEKCKTLRALGRQALKNYWQEAIVFVLVTQLMLQLPALIYNALPLTFDQSGIIAGAINLYGFLVAGAISLSLSNFFICIFRQKKLENLSGIKFGFGYFPKALGLHARILIFTWLWSLLFVVPGIIAAINYSQAFNILADNPEKSPAQCMIESKFIMRGNKMKYVLLLLSFVGWYFLAIIPQAICSAVLDSAAYQTAWMYVSQGNFTNAIIYASDVNPITNILGLLTVIPSVYCSVSEIAFFDILTGKLVVRDADSFEYAAQQDMQDAFENTTNPDISVIPDDPTADTSAESDSATETAAESDSATETETSEAAEEATEGSKSASEKSDENPEKSIFDFDFKEEDDDN